MSGVADSSTQFLNQRRRHLYGRFFDYEATLRLRCVKYGHQELCGCCRQVGIQLNSVLHRHVGVHSRCSDNILQHGAEHNPELRDTAGRDDRLLPRHPLDPRQ
ncbi:hypothetical protein CEXT_398831 [Caerostris extrusa]|uniref:Uncharacterized protein n=1 Tax=Caerostris extrusa TaxID=172846 RepID=A0AAV4PNA5_CAEEX|nr:hypothetical protein CEXT_398831 [Caerostris extrusa]